MLPPIFDFEKNNKLLLHSDNEQLNFSLWDKQTNQKLRHEIDKILIRAAAFTGLFMGCLFLLRYEIENNRPDINVAIFTFLMSFCFSMLIWIVYIVINNYNFVNFLKISRNSTISILLRGALGLLMTSALMYGWAQLDLALQMESIEQKNIVGLIQIRGLYIFGFCFVVTWGIEKALFQQKAMTLISQLRQENFEAKFELLKQQVNPHFLFNSLNILKGMIRTQNVNAEEYLMKLAEVYRYILQSNTKESVLLSEELVILDAYFFMLKNRFREAITLNIHLPKELEKTEMPPMAFQMLVENCVKHNVLTQAKVLKIEIFEENKYIVVQNNLQPKNALDSSHKVGLQNLNHRYEFLCNKNILIENNGQYFVVKLPIIQANS